MLKHEEYQIQYKKILLKNGVTRLISITDMREHMDIAFHITYSTRYLAQDQINELDKALRGIRIQEDWGEILGSQLDIFPSEGLVQVGMSIKRIPIQDFKQLLEECVAFLDSNS